MHALLPYGRDLDVYKTEPYVLAADVYANPAHIGRGGWTWYTGAAGWYRRTSLEELFGLKLENGLLYIRPHLPADWPSCRITRKIGETEYDIVIKNGYPPEITVNGRPYHGEGLPAGIINK